MHLGKQGERTRACCALRVVSSFSRPAMSCPRPALTSCGRAASGTVSSAAMASALIFLSHSRRKCLEPSVLFLRANTICAAHRLSLNALSRMLHNHS